MIAKDNKVSVVIRAHRDGPYLHETIKSVLNQSNLGQITVVLDHPSEKLLKICRSFESISLLNFILLDHSNLSRAMNIGIANSFHELISVIDSDDIMLENKLSIQVEFLATNLNSAVVGTNFYQVDSLGRKLRYVKMPEIVKVGEIDRKTPCPIAHSTVLFRKNTILELGGYNEKYAWVEDIELWLRVNKKYELHNIQSPFVHYRVHTLQTTSTNFHQISKTLVAAKIENGLFANRYMTDLKNSDSIEHFYKIKKLNYRLIYFITLEFIVLKMGYYKQRRKFVQFYTLNLFFRFIQLLKF